MKNPFEKRKSKGPKASRLLEIDAWIDSTLYESQFAAAETWENITIFFRRFRATGWRRIVFELLSEGFTMGTAGCIVMLALAMPAFEETTKDWRAQDDYAVTFLDRYGNEIGKRGILQRDSVPVDEMPDYVIKSVLATEDRRFFEHFGIDFVGLARAMFENARANAVVQGGSTLTQQLAKNLFLSNERTLERKIKEAFLALWLEANLTKKEILQLYLDRAYMGGGTFGIAAAAEFYFNKDVKDLSMAEGAMLAGLFKAPARYAPHVNLPAARARANEVLTNLVQSGFFTEGQVIAARRHPATPVDRDSGETPDYFLDWAFEQVKDVAARMPNHALVARTTIDMNLQKAAEESCEFHLRQFGKSYGVEECAMVVLENNGAVRAIVGGRDYGQSQFNRATKALRQAGSSFKPYVYAAGMEAGLTPETVIPDAPISWGRWSPKNYSRGYRGNINLTTALVKSINTVPVRMLRDKIPGGSTTVKALCEAMGVESEISTHKTMALGISGMTVMDQATGYLTFADGGLSGKRHGITQLTTYSGDVLYDYSRDAPAPKRVLSEKTVDEMNSILVQIPEWGTARRAALEITPAAGKTGTTQSYRDAWFVGFTGNYTAAVWMGNDDYSPTHRLTGGSLPAMTWKRVMEYAHQGIELKPIPGAGRPVPEAPEKKEDGSETAAGANGEPAPDRPLVLSAETVRVLRNLADAFHQAAPLPGPAPSARLTAIDPTDTSGTRP
ncbi:penicillin-binding protein [Zhengella mangrovi]|uniref:Penicillin-binding protein n=1 Tax=Zhengella mangrovi TaxID=1982044 RepID=A0A2G1QS91_9HYPH|nr:PBP1A family penicillin-binding protein [Zhengella mangrovi]PHP68362.1 penicillin-binding protein [Zhengella mangrovi]